MDKEITDILRKPYPISDCSIALLLQNMEEVNLSKGDTLFRIGQTDNHLYFIKKGCLRAYVPKEGKEINMWFAFEYDVLASMPGYVKNKPSDINVESIEDSTLLRFSRAKLEELFLNNIELANWGRKLIELEMLAIDRYYTIYNSINAKRRYELLLKEAPQLFQRAALKHIASIIGITPESLSRIRSSKK
ncbi:MAG: Crp/Fnr family transcriptional regulator [Bacteroidales bacterium]|nr:Crp/Fnr family transcriptional regulator [Bacteroidales bacterium]